MEHLELIGKTIQEGFQNNKRVLSFAEYLALVEENPRRHARSAAQYVRDMFDYFGTEAVSHPCGEARRFKLFDAPWDNGKDRLVGEEPAQNAIYRILHNFVRQRQVNRFILLHGSNGSSKSTITELIARGLEHYSTLDEGAIYCFNWIFPSQKVSRTGIGFAGADSLQEANLRQTYAYLEDEAVDARLTCELHDHPLLLIPQALRQQFLAKPLGRGGKEESFALSDYIAHGGLCHKCTLIFEALLNAYHGDYLRVLRHIQVERFYISQRYRKAATRVEPQLAVDAKARQVTADRSLGALPTALQSISLYELEGDLVQANRGVIDYPDLLKRPVEAFKYLLSTVEDGRVVLDQANVFFDLIFVGSSNDTYVNAFMESPEWMSFKGRIELVRVPYLLDYTNEHLIYNDQIREAEIGKHIAPHTTTAVALWAVLTRMHRPARERYEKNLAKLVEKLSPLDKARLYATGRVPRDVKGEDAKVLKAGIPKIWAESANEVVYEGRMGASPREVKTAILNAAQNDHFECLTPQAVFEELRQLVQETSVYAWLRVEPKDGYYDHRQFIKVAEEWYLDQADQDVRAAMGLVEEASYEELFARYMQHVTHFVRREKLRNPITGGLEDPDEKLMSEVERELGMKGSAEEFRQSLMTKIGAWSVDNVGEKPDYSEIFPDYFERLSAGYYEQQKQRITRLLRDALEVLAGEEAGIRQDNVRKVHSMLERLKQDFKYCDHCAREAITLLVRHRYSS